jgi:phage terminase large subunit-like protein
MSRRRIVVSIAFAGACAMATGAPWAAAAAPAQASADFVTKPIWVKILNERSLNIFYPDRAARSRVSGYSIIECSVNRGGALVRCVLVSEDPKEQGFGSALLKVPEFLKIGPVDEEGLPTADRRIRLAGQFGALKDQDDEFGLNLFVVGN